MTSTKNRRETITRGWQPSDGAGKAIVSDEYVEVAEQQLLADLAGYNVESFRHVVEAMSMIDQQPYQVAIFESTGQAIHVAYTIMSQPAQQDSMLRKSLVRILDAMSNLSPRLSAWLGQLRGEPSGTVHFDGLSSNDVRAQCALILLAVRTRLPDPEMWALQAKYCMTEYEDIGKKRRYAFSGEKAVAIKALSDWLVQTSAFADVPSSVMDCMVAKFYANHAKTEISFRQLAKTFGGDHLKYFRAYGKVKKILRPLEDMAVNRLSPYFAEQGIVMAHELSASELRLSKNSLTR
ncbi:hypothetical protein [Herbaspirillum sp. ST 5-3]|uniref:hypothetical protein n=1 Tax=Oxalobacteraceae TaxID=75682 RepID=UPI0010A2F274|nr:hypothetical protein [Herbaspirillum sp. ST 5-3]